MRRMSGLVRIGAMSALLALCACTASAEKPDSPLDCAALISAASHLSAQGQMKSDPEFDSRALNSSMIYLAAYAIPKRLREPVAFRELNARRAELIGSVSPAAILTRAKTCIRKTPGQ